VPADRVCTSILRNVPDRKNVVSQ